MIKRIVKMTFREEKIEEFLVLFEEIHDLIRHFDGCRHLELWRSKDPANVFFTYSLWESEAALEAYRRSHLFRNTWSRTKALFAGRAEAWSVEVVK